jgi:hypothetical protein
MEIPDKKTVESKIRLACDFLYDRGKQLIREKAHERTIVAKYLLPPLVELFPEWDVDPEYNREGEERTPKRDLNEKRLFPDGIIHKRGPNGPNLAVIQVKGFWNLEKREKDENSLHRIRAKHGYLFLYRLELDSDSYELIQVPV